MPGTTRTTLDAVGEGKGRDVNEHEQDGELTQTLQTHFALGREREDLLWERFSVRRQEAAAWAAFGMAMALMNGRLELAQRASMPFFNLLQGR